MSERATTHPQGEESAPWFRLNTEADEGATTPRSNDGEPTSAERTPAMATFQPPGYEGLTEIGRGGAGIVYRARETASGRDVAIKVLSGIDRRDVVAHVRFDVEVAALAQLRHPNIVQVLRSGLHDGTPYLVLEYIEGGTLADRLRNGPLAARAAVELLETIARAVQHAHQHGVLHRDLKPSNILLTREGAPQVADFGLAKNLDQDLSLTQTGHVLGTPSYMAPEQLVGNAALTTTVDVYSLGVVLYEMLTGQRPFSAPTPIELMLQVRSSEPARPSAQQPGLPRDVETICLKCLEKEPARRYATAGALADDLRRFLDGKPIEARPVGSVERVWKWCRRSPAVATLAVALALLLLAVAIGSPLVAWHQTALRKRAEQAEGEQRESTRAAKLAAQRAGEAEAAANRERNTALAEKQRADEQSATTQAVNDFLLSDLLSQASPRNQANSGMEAKPDLTVREAIDRAAVRVHEQFRDKPQLEADVRMAIGSAYRGLGDTKSARAQFQAAVDLRRARLGENSAETMAATTMLGLMSPAKEAVPLLEDALARCRTHLRPRHPESLGIVMALASAYRAAGQHDKALPLYEEACAGRRVELGPEHVDTMRSIHYVGLAYQTAGRLAEARAMFQEAYALRKATLGPDHPDTLASLGFMAAIQQQEGRLKEALALMEEAAKGYKLRMGLEHPETIRQGCGLAVIYRAVGRRDDAEKLLDELLTAVKAKHGPTHASVAVIQSSRAGLDANAAKALRGVLTAQRRRLAADSPELATTLVRLGECLVAQKQYEEAERTLKEALDIGEKHSPKAWNPSEAQALLGEARQGQSQP